MGEKAEQTKNGYRVVAVPGDLLISTVSVEDYFSQSVILLIDTGEEGDAGIILNRYSPMSLRAALPEFADHVTAPDTLFEGGPCDQLRTWCLSELPIGSPDPQGWRRITNNVGVVDIDVLAQLPLETFDKARIFFGYAGWEPGQLASELEDGSWILSTATAADIFTVHPDRLWRNALRRIPSEAAFFSAWTSTPTLN